MQNNSYTKVRNRMIVLPAYCSFLHTFLLVEDQVCTGGQLQFPRDVSGASSVLVIAFSPSFYIYMYSVYSYLPYSVCDSDDSFSFIAYQQTHNAVWALYYYYPAACICACAQLAFTPRRAGGVRQGSRGTYLLSQLAEFHTFSRL